MNYINSRNTRNQKYSAVIIKQYFTDKTIANFLYT